ncbi:MAG: hypothetical protein H6999_10855 [Hahellaceae bacterium]|nr:hypothetical protein [Hahellaceae bacterium]
MMGFSRRGFLPAQDPAERFIRYPELQELDTLGHDLPSLLQQPDFRPYLKHRHFPGWPGSANTEDLPELRLYYVRMGFLASAYINQVGQPAENQLPANIAVPLVHACKLLQRPPILSYDGYALYNWKRFDKQGSIALGNIDTLQNFVHLYDEHWFILVHVEIEAIAARLFSAIEIYLAESEPDTSALLTTLKLAIDDQTRVLRRIPEKMSPEIYFDQFRPYIRFFEHATYEGVNQKPIDHRGETGAQSSIMPALVAFLKIPHQPSELINHLRDMRHYMPKAHRDYLQYLEALPSIKTRSEPALFDAVLESVAQFREVHYGWAKQYIDSKVSDPRGTGGTPFMKWLKQLIDETRAYKFSP